MSKFLYQIEAVFPNMPDAYVKAEGVQNALDTKYKEQGAVFKVKDVTFDFVDAYKIKTKLKETQQVYKDQAKQYQGTEKGELYCQLADDMLGLILEIDGIKLQSVDN